MSGMKVLLSGLSIGFAALHVACGTVPREQSERESRMLQAANECASQFVGIQVTGVDGYGRVSFEFGTGPLKEKDEFQACYQERIKALAPLLSAGRVATASVTTTTVPVEIIDGMTIVTVTVNGTIPARLLLDTGATAPVLRPALLERLGITVPFAAHRYIFRVFGGRTVEVPFVRLRSLAVAAVLVEDLDAGVYDGFPHAQAVDGVLGASFLKHFKVSLDSASRRLTLESR